MRLLVGSKLRINSSILYRICHVTSAVEGLRATCQLGRISYDKHKLTESRSHNSFGLYCKPRVLHGSHPAVYKALKLIQIDI